MPSALQHLRHVVRPGLVWVASALFATACQAPVASAPQAATTAPDASSNASSDASSVASSDASPAIGAADASLPDAATTDSGAVQDAQVPALDTETLPDAPDVATSDAPAPDTFVLPPDAPSDTNVVLEVVSALPGLTGKIMVTGDNKASGGGFNQPFPDPSSGTGPPLLASQQGTLPTTFYLHLPPGDWRLMAWVSGTGGTMIAGGMTCSGGGPGTVLVNDGAITKTKVELVAMMGALSVNKVCTQQGGAGWTSLLNQVDIVTTPPTKDGAAHFMQGMVANNRLWIAGSQDGYVSFDFPADAAKTQPLAGWKVWGGPMCNRLIQHGDVLYCSSRNGYLHVAKMGADQQIVSLDKVWLATNGELGTEGMVIHGGQLYIAAHRKGIWQVPPSLQSKPVIIAPPVDTDIWDVTGLDATHLLVGSDQGVHVLNLAAVGTSQNPWGPWITTPGPAAFLHRAGTRLWVGDLSGRLHAVDVANPAQPKLIASVQVPSSVYGVWGTGDRVYAAAGHYVVAADLLTNGPPQLVLRDASLSPRFALDIDPLNESTLLAAEFQAARRLHLEPPFATDRPVLMPPAAVDVAIAAVGDKVQGSVRVYNGGPVATVIFSAEVREAPGLPPQVTKGPWFAKPGQFTTVPFAFVKSQKGLLQHELTLNTEATGQSALTIPLRENTWLHAGDTLPPLKYQDVAGKSWDVNAGIQGKVAVILVAAHSCPVAFMGMAAAGRQLKPLIDQGKLVAFGLNPWDTGSAPEVPILNLPFPVLHTPLTTKDGHDWSEVLDVTLGQPIPYGPPMPIVYVLNKQGTIVLGMWGYQPTLLAKVIEEELAKP